MKKIVCLLLALVLIGSLMSVPAFATDAESTPAPENKVTITKHPTGETVDEGGSAVFIARADNATAIVWRIVSNDTTNTVQAADAHSYFGCDVDGLGTETLVISKIPASMDGWRVEAKFEGPGGPVYSNGAMITVNGAKIKAPTISAQPQGASLESGQTTTLTVSAATTNGSLRFQWYKNTANSSQGGTPIEGATSASYTPEEITGTTYYYVSVKSADNGRESQAVTSNAVAVTYAAPANAPASTDKPEESAPPETQAPLVPVVDVTEEPENGSGADNSGSGVNRDESRSASPAVERASNALNMLTVVGGVLAVAAVAGGITALVLRRRGGDDDEDDE